MCLVRDIRRAESAYHLLITTGQVVYSKIDFDTSQDQRCFLLQNFPDDFILANNIVKAENNRTSRLRARIKLFLEQEEPTIFLTLTFSDKVLQNTTPETRRRYVTRYLKSQSAYYIANIDFGSLNGREHYHAVILGKVSLSDWEYGIINAESVGNRSSLTRKNIPIRYKNLPEEIARQKMRVDTERKLSKYVSKLTNHAIKETTKRNAIIYSRDLPKAKPLCQLEYLAPEEYLPF